MTVMNGFAHCWGKCLGDRIDIGQPSTNSDTQVSVCTLREVSEANYTQHTQLSVALLHLSVQNVFPCSKQVL